MRLRCSEDKAFLQRLQASIDQMANWPFFTVCLNLSQFSELGCFSLTNWREDLQADAGGSKN